MRRVFIVGNAGAARECFWLLDDMCKGDAALDRSLEFGGFLAWRGFSGDLKSLVHLTAGETLDYHPEAQDVFVIGIGSPAIRQDVYAYLTQKNAHFLTLLHPLAQINPTACVGEANIFQRNSTVFCDAVLGNGNYLNGAVNVSHDAIVGDFNFIGPFSLVLGQARVGSGNSIAARCTLLPKSRIGNGNVLAPGSVIYKGCRDFCRMAGNPAVNMGRLELQGLDATTPGIVHPA